MPRTLEKRYSPLEHIGRSVWGAGYSENGLFAMLTSYLDEAGGKDHGFTVVAGWVASVEEWDNFEVDWKLFLISYKVPYLHMAKYSQCKKPYDKWKNIEHFRARFIHEASEIIHSRVRRGFICYVSHEAFEKANQDYELSELLGSPYGFAGRICAESVNQWKRQTSKTSDLEYIFEDGGPDKGGLLKAMDIVPKLPAPIFKPSRDIVDRKHGKRRGVVQLQAADYLAYEIRKYILDHPLYKIGARTPRGSLIALTGTEVVRRFADYPRVIQVCNAWHEGGMLRRRKS